MGTTHSRGQRRRDGARESRSRTVTHGHALARYVAPYIKPRSLTYSRTRAYETGPRKLIFTHVTCCMCTSGHPWSSFLSFYFFSLFGENASAVKLCNRSLVLQLFPHLSSRNVTPWNFLWFSFFLFSSISLEVSFLLALIFVLIATIEIDDSLEKSSFACWNNIVATKSFLVLSLLLVLLIYPASSALDQHSICPNFLVSDCSKATRQIKFLERAESKILQGRKLLLAWHFSFSECKSVSFRNYCTKSTFHLLLSNVSTVVLYHEREFSLNVCAQLMEEYYNFRRFLNRFSLHFVH